MLFTKTTYLQAWACPKYAWIGRYRPERLPQDESALARMREGSEVGALARGLFGPFTDVTARREDGTPDTARMAERTREEMARGTPVICEAAFRHEDLYCAVDLLRRTENGWAICEVKASTDPDREEFIADTAYQKYVLERCGVTVDGVYLITLDGGYVLGPEGIDPRKLFVVTDVTAKTDAERDTVPGVLRTAGLMLRSDAEPVIGLGDPCHDCPCFAYCARELPTPNVFDLYRLSWGKTMEYYRRGLVGFAELEEAGVSANAAQLRQMDFALRDRGTYADVKAIRNFLSGLRYPLYFLDFEAMQPAVPVCVGTRPFAQIPFQYSLHFIGREGGELQHREFLAESGTDPRRGIAEALCRDIPADACVTAYNRSFESTRLRELADTFPDLGEHLRAIAGNVVDLLVPFQSGWYYNRAMGGSFSIKSVLPAICPDDPAMDYHSLEGVNNGSEAMNLFPRTAHMEPEEREKARRDLLAYCRLDTLALVKVWEALRRAAE